MKRKNWEQRISTMLLEAWGTLTVYKNSYAHLSTEIVAAWPQGLQQTGMASIHSSPPPQVSLQRSHLCIVLGNGCSSLSGSWYIQAWSPQGWHLCPAKEVWFCFLQSRQVDPDICVLQGSPKALDLDRQDYDHVWAPLSVTISLSQRGATVYPLMERNGMHRLSMRLDTMDRKMTGQHLEDGRC